MKSEFEPREAVSWHALPIDEVYEKLSSGPGGLSCEEAAHRLEQFGPNELPARRPPGIITIFLHQFKSPLIYILLVAAVISFALGDYKDAGFILAVVFLNAVIGLVQEWKAEKSASRLQSLLRITAHVRRGGKDEEVDSATIVPGDIVLLESGIRVPADLRLIHAANLTVDES
ncbi:MAG: cation-transporting P-type ATPase, partial [Methanoregulaceae archaeon]|nr:cation-transporting P-type ATPase [Methanoregulaceae archaeon]